jgi:DNA-directed RNA polymerase subunit RPC12/RpoP
MTTETQDEICSECHEEFDFIQGGKRVEYFYLCQSCWEDEEDELFQSIMSAH